MKNSLDKSIISKEITHVTSDILEIGIDNFLEEGLLKEIPIVKSIIGVKNVGIAIRDKIFLKKIISFLFEIKSIPEEKRKKFIKKLNNNSKYNHKVGEKLIVIVDRLDDYNKSKLIGKLFCYTIQGRIDYDTFLRLSSIINNCFLSDLPRLKLFKEDVQNITEFEKYQLFNIGLLEPIGIDGRTFFYSIEETPPPKKLQFKISEFGILIDDLLLNG